MPSEQSFRTYGRWDRTSASDQNRLRRAVEELQRGGGRTARNINGVDLPLPEIDRWLLIVLDAASTTTVPVPTYSSWHQVDLDESGTPVAIGDGIVGSADLVARSISGYDAPASATQAYVARISMEDNAVTFFAYGSGGGGAGTLTVQAADGSPTYPSTTTLQFEELSGFVITQPTAGTVKIAGTSGADPDASLTVRGYVNLSPQTLGKGDKTIPGDLYVSRDLDVPGTFSPTRIYLAGQDGLYANNFISVGTAGNYSLSASVNFGDRAWSLTTVAGTRAFHISAAGAADIRYAVNNTLGVTGTGGGGDTFVGGICTALGTPGLTGTI